MQVITLRGPLLVSRTGDDPLSRPSPSPPSPRMSIQNASVRTFKNVPVRASTTSTCVQACGPVACTHRDVLNAHTEAFTTYTRVFFQRATPHTPQPPPRTQPLSATANKTTTHTTQNVFVLHVFLEASQYVSCLVWFQHPLAADNLCVGFALVHRSVDSFVPDAVEFCGLGDCLRLKSGDATSCSLCPVHDQLPTWRL